MGIFKKVGSTFWSVLDRQSRVPVAPGGRSGLRPLFFRCMMILAHISY
jgi:hypothetical protein